MSSLLSSQGIVLATAMAVSGTVILFAFRRQRPLGTAQFALDQSGTSTRRNLRSCISSDDRKREQTKKKKKRVHFADDLVETVGEDGEFGREKVTALKSNQIHESHNLRIRGIPANWMVLYKGMLQDRAQRMACW